MLDDLAVAGNYNSLRHNLQESRLVVAWFSQNPELRPLVHGQQGMDGYATFRQFTERFAAVFPA